MEDRRRSIAREPKSQFPPAEFQDLRETSRKEILEAIGRPRNLTFIRGAGNRGDQLIDAGTRRLLADLSYREISLSEATHASGHTALLAGGGAWCEPFQGVMSRVLELIEARFERVIVFPSSFDVSTQSVRLALSKTRALVFCREAESFRQVREVCQARLALDAAFFFDYAPYAFPGQGTLDAFRTDVESAGLLPIPIRNHDVSLQCDSLDEWLWTISRFATVRTDRAHVMIAAAMLGKRVEYLPSSYHKVPGIAEYALSKFPLRRIIVPTPTAPPPRRRKSLFEAPTTDVNDFRRRLTDAARNSLSLLPGLVNQTGGSPRATIVVLSWNRLERTRALLASLSQHVRMPYRLLVIDNNSAPEVREGLKQAVEEQKGAELILLDRNLGCAGGRQLSLRYVDTEYVVFLDNDVEVFPGTLEHLIRELDEHPDTVGSGAEVVLPSGRVQWCGGNFWVKDGVLEHQLLGEGLPFGDPLIGESGECGWIGGAAGAYRREIFDEFPIDTEMAGYFEDIEWCYRVSDARGGKFRRVVEALALHHPETKTRAGASPGDIIRTLPFVESAAHIYFQHGLILEDLFSFVSELSDPETGRDLAAAKLFLELTHSKGGVWLLLNWLEGNLSPLFQGVTRSDCERARDELSRIYGSRWWSLATAFWNARRRLSRIAGHR